MRSERSAKIARLLLLLLATLLATSCARHGYKLYPGPTRPSQELAQLDIAWSVGAVEVDGLHVSVLDYRYVMLEPGQHEVRWSSRLGVSWWETRTDGEERSAVAVAQEGA